MGGAIIDVAALVPIAVGAHEGATAKGHGQVGVGCASGRRIPTVPIYNAAFSAPCPGAVLPAVGAIDASNALRTLEAPFQEGAGLAHAASVGGLAPGALPVQGVTGLARRTIAASH
jgi:hypothetical protein